ncbi:FAM173 family [Phytophthora cinnamomi]|uniref:FAM173 family n=1 Tax=Phytophthora cinnamomi TaxID=4785 RepID=UPI003559DC94|nr:FAM173 family [Phytophthora cinnamomi]
MATSRTREDRRRRLRQLVLEAARARANDALTLKGEDTEQELFAPFSPSPLAVIEAVWTKLEYAQLALTSEDVLVDLGCGDGRWLVSGVKRFGCKALGVELDENLVLRAREQVQQQQLQHKIQIELGDVMLADISQAKLVIVYAFAESLPGIAQRLKEQLKQDTSVLSVGFRVPDWKPYWSEREGGLRWYFYRMSECC